MPVRPQSRGDVAFCEVMAQGTGTEIDASPRTYPVQYTPAQFKAIETVDQRGPTGKLRRVSIIMCTEGTASSGPACW